MSAEMGRVDGDRPMRWNGWGDPDKATALPLAVRALLPLLLGRIRRPGTPVELGEVRIAASALTDEDRSAFESAIGAANVDLTDETRIRHAGGRSTADLLR